MQNNLSISGLTVQSVYSNYKEGKYIVNRRYQRKLVWTANDKNRTNRKWNSKYGIHPRKYDSFCITGIANEAEKYHKNLDSYCQKIKQTVNEAPIDESTKRRILSNLMCLKYYEKDLIVMKIRRESKPMKYEGQYFVRKMAHTAPSPVDDVFEFSQEFTSQTKRYPYN
ncbi:hypothetical protein [Dolichospermum circinale]|uniref:hypothetical protein n=1 Tax=Dolichospermum circinale TaxID=109265 RepID=UPI00232B1C71|nr:hypothetical protein [Dolichospermum circinale]MDB9448846.1 hypothetical protein [Dolichospermum circinale CS-547]